MHVAPFWLQEGEQSTQHSLSRLQSLSSTHYITMLGTATGFYSSEEMGGNVSGEGTQYSSVIQFWPNVILFSTTALITLLPLTTQPVKRLHMLEL
uniref:Uncharacterized protein n=1 Tax=Anguilla anguilla TaxID=7936 RepID=A0A0E9WNR5_ANGAN